MGFAEVVAARIRPAAKAKVKRAMIESPDEVSMEKGMSVDVEVVDDPSEVLPHIYIFFILHPDMKRSVHSAA